MASTPTSTIDAPTGGAASPEPAAPATVVANPTAPATVAPAGRPPAVPAERLRRAFEQAIGFDAFLAGVATHADEFAVALDRTALDDADRALLATIPARVDVLAIVEDWCPDVVVTLPVVHRIAEASDRFDLHVLVRGPETRDVADAYPFEGRSHIPTYVVLNAEGDELGVLVERTPELGVAVGGLLDAFLAEHPGLDRAAFPAGLTDDARADLTRRSFALRADLHELERRTLVRDLVAIAAGTAPTRPTAA
ncbi:thioredoxin family protein [Patulibacter sp. NPDC049589]|uniref:thioredoxin family protein n=1 Tax=Patulibacter sp. NPDC049589 TaxID=3154731 RepID=UPI00342346A0